MREKHSEQKIFDLLREENQLYGQLLNRVNDQKEAIRLENEERLAEVIQEKNDLIEKIAGHHEQIEELLKPISPTARERLAGETKSVQKDIENALKEIMVEEETCYQELKNQKSELADKIIGLRKGQSLLKGYGTLPFKSTIIKKA